MIPVANELRSLVDLVLRVAPNVAWQEPYGPGKWRRVEVLGHLIDSASNNHQRFVRALIQSRLDFPSYQQEESVSVQAYESFGATGLIELWAGYNHLIAHVMERIGPDKQMTPCRIGNDEETTLEFLATDYNRHLIHHLKQILTENSL